MATSHRSPEPQAAAQGKSQIEKFREAARELETDDSEERFAATVKRIGQAKPVKGEKSKAEQ